MPRLALLLAPMLFAASSAFAQETRLNGDVNNDGSVTATDALAVLSAAVDLPLPDGYTLSFGNADCDGTVGVRDAQIILAWAVSLDVTQFCVGQPSGGGVAQVTLDAGTGQVVAGGQLQLVATARDSANQALEGRTFTWTTSDATKATVSSEGVVTGVAVGTVTITAQSESKSASVAVTVMAAGGTNTLTVSPSVVTVLIGSTVKLTATLRDAAGNPVSNTIAWTTADATKATVDAAGVVTGVALGVVIIKAAEGSLEATAQVTVTSPNATANRDWTGSVSSDWGTAGNWDPPAVPIATDTISVPREPANQPQLNTAQAAVAGLVIDSGATLNIGANELQVTGRVDVDGEVLGTGRLTIQGLNQSISYVRGRLPSVTIAGNTEIVASTIITGNLETLAGSVLNLNAHSVHVSNNLNMKGTLLMNTAASTLDVRGNARFFTDESTVQTVLSAGLLRVGGDLKVIVPPSITVSPFPASGTHRVILDGIQKQFVRDSGVRIVEFQQLDVVNTTGGVEFDTDSVGYWFRVKSRMNVNTAAALSGKGRVNVLSNFTSALGGSVMLRNMAVKGVLAAGAGFSPDTLTLLGGNQIVPTGDAYAYQNVVVAGTAQLSATTSTFGSVILGCLTTRADCSGGGAAALDMAGRRLTVGADLRQTQLQPLTPIYMTEAADSLTVLGSVLGPVNMASGNTQFTANAADWTAGVLRVGGDFIARGTGATGTHVAILDGSVAQTLQTVSGFSFQALTIADSVGVTMPDTTVGARKYVTGVLADLNVTTAVALTGNGRMNVSGSVQTTTGSSIAIGALSVGSILRASGDFSPDTAEFNSPSIVQTIQFLPGYQNVVVKGKATFGGSMTFGGSLLVLPGGELNVEGRHVTVTKDMRIQGILRMQDVKDSITVLGDSTVFSGRADPSVKAYATSGVLTVKGSLVSDSTGFYPTGGHKLVFNPGKGKKMSGGVWQTVEVIGTGAGTGLDPTIANVMVNGDLLMTSGVGTVRLETMTVGGDAVLTQQDTVRKVLSAAIVKIKGDLTARRLITQGAASAFTVDGNFTLVDSAYLSGTVIYYGTYTEQGFVDRAIEGNATHGRLKSIRWVQQPTNVVAGVKFSPVISVELVDSSDVRLVGTAVVRLTNVTDTTQVRRVVAQAGVATFPDLVITTSSTGRGLSAQSRVPSGTITTANSGVFTVTAAAPAQVRMTNGVLDTVVAGTPLRNEFGGSFIAQVTDAFGNAAPYDGDVTLTTGAASPDTVYGIKTKTLAANGSVTFDNAQLRKVGAYTIIPTVTGLTGIETDTVVVVHGTANKLGVVTQPGNGIHAQNVSPLPVVEIQDAWGNRVPNHPIHTLLTVTLTQVSPTGPIAGSLSYAFDGQEQGRFTASTFIVQIPTTGGPHVFTATFAYGSTGLTPATSAEFTISP